MTSVVDTNVLIYRYDRRFPEKRELAEELLQRGVAERDLVFPHQVLVEFVAAVSRPRKELGGLPLLEAAWACREAESLMRDFKVLHPDEEVLRTAFQGLLAYQLSWWDAHLWAYAEVNGVPEILSEDFEHGRHYGSVRVVDPFLAASGEVHELPAMYETS